MSTTGCRGATLLPGEKPSQLLTLETCSALISSVLQLPSELVPKFLKARNPTVVKLLIKLGLHGLTCFRNASHFPRDSVSNSIPKRSFTRINLLSTLEPVGLTGDGRRPDGLTLGPWYRGLSLLWSATVVDTLAQCH